MLTVLSAERLRQADDGGAVPHGRGQPVWMAARGPAAALNRDSKDQLHLVGFGMPGQQVGHEEVGHARGDPGVHQHGAAHGAMAETLMSRPPRSSTMRSATSCSSGTVLTTTSECRNAYGGATTTGCTRDMAILPYRGCYCISCALVCALLAAYLAANAT